MSSNDVINMPIINGILKISACDYEKASKYTWSYYTWKNSKKVRTYMNRSMHNIAQIVFDADEKQLIYHKNGDFLDFTRDNIVICTRSELSYLRSNEQKANNLKSEYFGIYYYQVLKKWRVSILKKGTKKHGGNYETALEAAIAADYLAIGKYGDLAKRNFPELSYNELEMKYKEIQNKYGACINEKLTKCRQGRIRNENKSSKYVGVSWHKVRNKWHVQLSYNKTRCLSGFYDDEIEAAKAYDKKAIEIYGEYARTNFDTYGKENI